MKHKLRQIFRSLSPWWSALFVALMTKQFLFATLIGFDPLRIKTQVVTVFGTCCAFMALCWVFNRPWSARLALVISSLLGFILFTNALYIRQFHAPLSLVSTGQTSNLGGLWESILGLTSPFDLLLFIDLPLLLAWKQLDQEREKANRAVVDKLSRSRRVLVVFGTLMVAIATHAAAATKEFLLQHRTFLDLSFDNLENIVRLSAPVYYAIEGYHLLAAKPAPSLAESEHDQFAKWAETRRETISSARLLPGSPAFGLGRGKSLIIIQVEALESSFVQTKIGSQEITPNLNALITSETSFANFRSQTAHGNTSDAELAVLAAWHPLRLGSAFFRFPHSNLLALPAILKENGFQTVAYHGNRASFWNRSVVFPKLGFEQFRTLGNLPSGEVFGMGLDDKTLFQALLDDTIKAVDQGRPIFAFAITISSHTPFLVPAEKVESSFNAVLPNGMLGDYMRSLRYADSALGEFLERLKQSGIWDKSVVFIYGDHEAIPAHLRNESLPEPLRAKAIGNDRRVPAILHIPGASPSCFTRLTGQVDLMPTLLHIMGISPDTKSSRRIDFGINAFLDAPRSLVFAAEGRVVGEANAPDEDTTLAELTMAQRLLETCAERSTCGEFP